MKSTITYFLVLGILFLSACGQQDQQVTNDQEEQEQEQADQGNEVDLRFPALSPRSEVQQVIGITSVTIDYSRPSVRDRVIWGDLVPYNENWRTGANAPTTIAFEHDVYINGYLLEAGEYAIVSVPREDEPWTFKFSDAAGDNDDEITIEAEARPSNQYRELMTFEIRNVTENSGEVVLAWENLETGFELEVETDNLVMAKIEKAMEQAGEDDWEVYTRSARYFIDSEKRLDQAEEWLDIAMEMEENWRIAFTRSRLMEARDNTAGAIEWIERALEIGREQEEEFGAESFLESQLQRLQEEA